MSEELIPFDIGPDERAPGVPFNNSLPRNPPDAATQALGRALAQAGSEEEAEQIYLSALVEAGVITGAEAEQIREEVRGG